VISNYSACRQCCGGDNIVCDFSALSDPDNRYETVEDWASTATHGYLTSEKTGIEDFDPDSYGEFDEVDVSEMMDMRGMPPIGSLLYKEEHGYTRDEEFEPPTDRPTTTEWITTSTTITTTTTTTQFPTIAYSTIYQYESTHEPTTAEATTTTYLYNTAEITADPDNPLSPLSELVQSYYEEAVSGNSTLTAEELRFLIKVLREQSRPVPPEAYEAYEEYADDYDSLN